jgi:hypothetical protein
MARASEAADLSTGLETRNRPSRVSITGLTVCTARYVCALCSYSPPLYFFFF